MIEEKRKKSLKSMLARVRRIEITAQRLVNEQLSGRYHSVFKGRGMSFDEVRPYAPGDEVRLIDWNVSARTGEVFIKHFVEERELTVMILADASGSMDFGLSSAEYRHSDRVERVEDTKRELAAQIAAAITLSAQMNNDRVGLLTFGSEVQKFIPPRKGRQHALRVIREVLAMDASGSPTDLGGALSYLGRVLKRRAAIFVVSDFEVPDFERELRVTAKRHDVHALYVRDPVEDRLPEGGIIPLQDAETGAVDFVFVDRGLNGRLESERRAHIDDVTRTLNRQKVPCTMFSTDATYEKPLAGHFARLKGKAL
ncbi:MAG: DUF58 domain-containing protein [Deltaproteobacteria bacterium]|nr:DUF58 domain-containing protein [Deltaproteobacteria bacterium]